MCKKLQLRGTLSPRPPPSPRPGLCPWTPLGTSVPKPPDWRFYSRPLWGNPFKKISEIPQKFHETEKPEARTHGWMTLTKILVPIFFDCLNCTKFVQLILKKIIKIVATSQILRLKGTKFDFGWPPDPLWELTALPRPLLDLRRPTFKGREGRGREGRGCDGRGMPPPF